MVKQEVDDLFEESEELPVAAEGNAEANGIEIIEVPGMQLQQEVCVLIFSSM